MSPLPPPICFTTQQASHCLTLLVRKDSKMAASPVCVCCFPPHQAVLYLFIKCIDSLNNAVVVAEPPWRRYKLLKRCKGDQGAEKAPTLKILAEEQRLGFFSSSLPDSFVLSALYDGF